VKTINTEQNVTPIKEQIMTHFRVAPNRVIKNNNRTYVADSTGLLTDVVQEDHAMILALGGIALVEAAMMPIGPGEAGQVLVSNGPGLAPSWGWSGAIGSASATGGTGTTGDLTGTTGRILFQSGGVIHSQPGPGEPGYVAPVVSATGSAGVTTQTGTTTPTGVTSAVGTTSANAVAVDTTGATNTTVGATGDTGASGYVVGAANTGATGVFAGANGTTALTPDNTGSTATTGFGAPTFSSAVNAIPNTGTVSVIPTSADVLGTTGTTAAVATPVLSGNVGPTVTAGPVMVGATGDTGIVTTTGVVIDPVTGLPMGSTGATGDTGTTGNTGATSAVVFDPISGLPIGLTGTTGNTGTTGT
jgi:collagen type VII alpha